MEKYGFHVHRVVAAIRQVIAEKKS